MALTTNGSRPILDASKSPGINAGRPVFCSASSLAACADAAPLDVLERPDGRGSIALEVASRDSREAGRACAANVEHRALTLLGNGGSSALAAAEGRHGVVHDREVVRVAHEFRIVVKRKLGDG